MVEWFANLTVEPLCGLGLLPMEQSWCLHHGVKEVI
jgi:hypothetical protein